MAQVKGYNRWLQAVEAEERMLDNRIKIMSEFTDKVRRMLEEKPFRTSDAVGTDPCELWFPDEEIGIAQFE